jgi:1-acyl-sn-glycerol-3-phosphate acyltransferase
MSRILKSIKNPKIVRKFVHLTVGLFTYPGITVFNRISITGMENLKNLPKSGVLFVCNHQTYFLDVITLFHIFSASKWRRTDRLGLPVYLLNPMTRINYVAAEQTMKSSWMSRLFLVAGGVTVKRTWNESSGEARSGLDPSDTRKIERSLSKNWVITFPQGTTTPFAPARKGTALIIKHHHPVVIPVVINGFSKAFQKTGVRLKSWGNQLTVCFKEPLKIDYNASVQQITDQIMDAIEQSDKYMPEALKS